MIGDGDVDERAIDGEIKTIGDNPVESIRTGKILHGSVSEIGDVGGGDHLIDGDGDVVKGEYAICGERGDFDLLERIAEILISKTGAELGECKGIRRVFDGGAECDIGIEWSEVGGGDGEISGGGGVGETVECRPSESIGSDKRVVGNILKK